jgi:hypothetical protein
MVCELFCCATGIKVTMPLVPVCEDLCEFEKSYAFTPPGVDAVFAGNHFVFQLSA